MAKVKQEWYTINEAAVLLGVHPNTIRNRIKDGSLAAGRVGWEWKIHIDEIKHLTAPRKYVRKSRPKP